MIHIPISSSVCVLREMTSSNAQSSSSFFVHREFGGSYKGISAGIVSESFANLTGGISERFVHASDLEDVSSSEFFARITVALKNGSLVTCSTMVKLYVTAAKPTPPTTRSNNPSFLEDHTEICYQALLAVFFLAKRGPLEISTGV